MPSIAHSPAASPSTPSEKLTTFISPTSHSTVRKPPSCGNWSEPTNGSVTSVTTAPPSTAITAARSDRSACRIGGRSREVVDRPDEGDQARRPPRASRCGRSRPIHVARGPCGAGGCRRQPEQRRQQHPGQDRQRPRAAASPAARAPARSASRSPRPAARAEPPRASGPRPRPVPPGRQGSRPGGRARAFAAKDRSRAGVSPQVARQSRPRRSDRARQRGILLRRRPGVTGSCRTAAKIAAVSGVDVVVGAPVRSALGVDRKNTVKVT